MQVRGAREHKFSAHTFLPFVYATFFILVLATGFSFAYLASTAGSAHAALPNVAQVVVKKAEATEVSDELSYPARVESAVQATVVSDIDGVVQEIPRSLGEKVKAGTVLMRLQHSEPGFTYSPYKVTAPLSGVVSLLKVTVGSRVNRGEALALITDPARVRIAVEFTPSDLARLKLGQHGTLIVRDQKYDVEISGLSPMIDPATGTAQGELKLSAPVKSAPVKSASVKSEAGKSEADKKRTAATAQRAAPVPIKPVAINLPAGLAGVVQFTLNSREAVMVPDDAVVYRTEQTFVRTVDKDKKAERHAVKIGARHDGVVEVLSGLKGGETYIVRSSRFVKDGEVVDVQADTQKE